MILSDLSVRRPVFATVLSLLLVILIAWLAPMAVRLSTLQVKFLRYWEPLVMPAVLIAAWWLLRLPRSIRRKAVTVVAAGTAVWGLAYAWSFLEPHPHRTAAEWFNPRTGEWSGAGTGLLRADRSGKLQLPDFPGGLKTTRENEDWALKLALRD